MVDLLSLNVKPETESVVVDTRSDQVQVRLTGDTEYLKTFKRIKDKSVNADNFFIDFLSILFNFLLLL